MIDYLVASPSRSRLRWACALLATLVVAGCGGTTPETKRPGAHAGVAPPARTLAGPAPMKASFVADLDDEDTPYASAREGRIAVVAFVKQGQVVVQPVDLDGNATGEPAAIAAATQPSSIVVRRHRGAFWIAWDDKVEQNRVLTWAVVDITGQKRSGPFKLAPIASNVSYFDVVAAGDATFLLHEISGGADGSVDVLATPIDEREAKAPRSAVAIARGVHAWSAPAPGATPGRDVPFGLVRAQKDAQGNLRGRVGVVRLDPSAKVSSEIVVRDKPFAELDLEMVATAQGEVLAWTDYQDPEGLVYVARVQGQKVELAPRRLFESPAPQALVGLVAPEARGSDFVVAWETPEDAGAVRSLRLTATSAEAKPGRTVGLLFAGQGVPELAPDGDGYAALTLAPAVHDGAPAATEPQVWPTVVRFDRALNPRSSEPVRFAQATAGSGVPDVTHALECEKGRCTVLAHALGDRVNVFVVEAPVRASTWHSVAQTGSADGQSSLAGTTLLEGVDASDLAAIRLSADKGLVSYVTFLAEGTESPEPAPKGEPPFAAELAVQPVSGAAARGKPIVVSKRALSSGGVAVASLPGKKGDEAAIAWVASDKGEPQVFVTKLDEDGKKIAQKKVTTVDRKKKKSGASAVTIAAAPGGEAKGQKRPPGFVVAWADTREGKPELFAARVNRDLEKTVVDKRLTTGAGDVADVTLLVRGNDAFVAYSASPGGSAGDIFWVRLDASTLDPAGKEARVFASEGHSRAPQIFAVKDRLYLAWIEDPSAGGDGRATLRLGVVDASGQLEKEPTRIDVPGAGVTSFQVACTEDGACRFAVAAHRAGSVQELWTVDVAATGVPGSPEKRGTLETRASTDLALRYLDAKTVVFVEPGARGRVRAAELR